MNKRNKRILACGLVVILLTSGLALVPGISLATSPAAYVPITLTNSQSTATPQNFSQLIIVNWSKYASYLNSNVSNVRFYSSNSFNSSSELYGWIETNNTTSATKSYVWVNLTDNVIGASSTLTIYMAFLPTTSSWSSHWGLAPQLSTVYGEFDNGAKVFEYYVRFGSLSSLPSGWSTTESITYQTEDIRINDGGAAWGYLYTSFTKYINTTIDFFGNAYQPNYNGNYVNNFGLQTAQSSNEPGYSMTVGSASTSGGTANIWFENSGNIIQIETNGIDSNYNKTYTTSIIGSTSVDLELNYSSPFYTNSALTAESTSYLFFNTYQTTPNAYIYYIDARETPPAGVMPSVSFGSTTVSSSGHQISFQQTSLPSGTKWGIRLNNTTAIIWQNSTSQYDNITSLANGTYTYQVINATGYQTSPSTAYTGTLTINGANLTQTIAFIGYKISFSESGLPSGVKWYVNLSDQSGLSESSAGQHLSSTTPYNNASLPNGSYSYTVTTVYDGVVSYAPSLTSGSFSISGASYSKSITFSAVKYYVNFTQLSKPKSLIWGVNLSGTIKTGTGNISYQVTNGTYYYNASALNCTFAPEFTHSE